MKIIIEVTVVAIAAVLAIDVTIKVVVGIQLVDHGGSKP